MKERKHYIENNNLKDATHIEVSVYYSKGGMSYFTNTVLPRGFYIGVTPVTMRNKTISFTAFTGTRKLLLEVKRYSDKQFTRAIELAKDVETELVVSVAEKNKAA